jgi:E3 ubiquitin-protein ligase SIAH1
MLTYMPVCSAKQGTLFCSVCRDKLKVTGNGKCHVCGVATGGYSRCYAMEQLVESIRFPCPNVIHGCTVRSTYYDQHCHRQACQHTPCHCPGNACGFVGSTATLLDHFTSAHDWPCATKVRAATTTDYGDDDVDCEFSQPPLWFQLSRR